MSTGLFRKGSKAIGSAPLSVLYGTCFHCSNLCVSGPGSSVGIATDYGVNGPGLESRWR